MPERQLVIVESPAKAKTIQKYLGEGVQVLASYGHVRDLLPKEGAVDPEHDFAMRYAPIERNERHVDAIAKALGRAGRLVLATDPDREGEAISWHLLELLRERGALDAKPVDRVVFHEITKGAIQEAMRHPRAIAMDLVNAQQARRALDFLVGFNLSPLLWRKVRPGLSAGRVQSAALRLICEREDEIEAFQAREYWTIGARLRKDEQDFEARLVELDGGKLEQFSIPDGESAERLRSRIAEAVSRSPLRVLAVERKSRSRQPSPPFTTSTLQQEAARKLGFSASRTMRIAQQLYEGVALAEGSVGLITYMRTDAVNLAEEAIAGIRSVIGDTFGHEFLPKEARRYKTKTKNAQEAHEAIRPTDVRRHPEAVKGELERDQYRLYELIWKRTVASQMAPARLDLVAVDLGTDDDWKLRANGSTVAFPGFMAVYQEGKDDEEEEGSRILPPLAVGDRPELQSIEAAQHFTEPPPRYSEASLVKTLEAYGIGRPSTYASIIQTLQQREYVEMRQRRFHPTDLGRVVNRFLVKHFEHYVDYGFTAQMEDELDAVSRGEKAWKPVLREFWRPFHGLLEEKAQVSRVDATSETLDEVCPRCGRPLLIRLGRHGRFIACSGYPECTYSRPLEGGEKAEAEPVGRDCPKCGMPLVYKTGRYGRFIGCSGYPQCRHIESLDKPKGTGVACPACGQGELVEKRSRYGKTFYSCSTYPQCQYAVWNPPIERACPRCRWPVLTRKTTKRHGEELVCPRAECGFHFPEAASDAEIAALLTSHQPPAAPGRTPAKRTGPARSSGGAKAKGAPVGKTRASKVKAASPKARKAAPTEEREAVAPRARTRKARTA